MVEDHLAHSSSDATVVAEQIGREPRGKWGCASRCSCGYPRVIETFPALEDGTPFPTTLWLTCKLLSREVSRIESSGAIGEFNEWIESDEEIRRQLEQATLDYLKHRDSMLFIDERSHPGGGPRRIKCLHAHVADELVNGNNPIGRETLKRIGWSDPEEPCI